MRHLPVRMTTDPEPDHIVNQIQGDIHGPVVQAGSIDTVHLHQHTDNVNQFHGPVDARSATFGADHDPTGHDDTEPA